MNQESSSNTRLAPFLALLKRAPESIAFEQVIAVIDANYDYQPTAFVNGVKGDCVDNKEGTNQGSCKIFAFAKLNALNQLETLHCFGSNYREDVLKNPDTDNHQNIRTYIRHGIDAVQFAQQPLAPKTAA